MNIITNLFGGRARSQLEQIARDTKPIFQTPEGRDEVVKSILHSEFPLVLSEYVFEIKDGKCISLVNYSDERLEFLRNLFQNGFTEESKQQYLDCSNSAMVANSSNRNTIFHAHPRNSPEAHTSEEAPHFSKADKKFSKKGPLGLVEYCVVDSNQDPIHLSTRLSLCYKGHVRDILEMGILLNPDGSYSSDDGDIVYAGRIPAVASATGNLVDTWIQSDASDRLTKYVMQHAVRRLTG